MEKLFRWVLKYPKTIIALTFVVVTLLASGTLKLSISNDFRVYLSKDNPQLQAYEAFEDNYVKSNTATFVISVKKSTDKNGDLFTQDTLKLIEQLTDELWQVDYVTRVSSLTNYLYTQSEDDDIQTDYLVEDAGSLNAQQLANIRRIALAEKRLRRFLTPDGKLTLILATLDLPEGQANVSLKVTEQLELIKARFRPLYPHLQIDNGGSTAFNATLARAVANDMLTLVPLSYLIIFAGLLIFLRSVMGTLAIFLLISSCLLTTFGVFGWIAPVLTPIAGFAPSILLSIMVADSVHILVTYFKQLREGKNKHEAILQSLQINFMPVLITSVTTMIGFLSLNFSASPPYRDLGNMVAIGVLIAFAFSLILLPALLMALPVGKLPQQSKLNCFHGFAEFIIKRKKPLVIVMTLVTITLVTFIPNNRISDNWANYFDESFEMIRLVKRVDGYLGGINALEYSLASNEVQGINSPEYLRQMDAFEQWYLTQPKIVSVKCMSQLLKDLNQVMHNDDPQWYKVPDSAELAAQYLLFYEMGLPQGMGLNNVITFKRDASRFTVAMTDAGSDEILLMDQNAQAWLAANAPAIKATSATGLGVVFAHIAQRNITSLLLGTIVALVGISVVLMVVLKSLKYGLISLVPNIIPAAMAYGLWGMTYGYVDISLSIVACSTLGIVVDDTVHFLHKYISARRSGLNAADSIREAFQRVGLALLTTSVVLASGFMILAISHMNTSATIGILMATTLIIALIVDFLLLPPLLLFMDRDK
ncbi:MAG: MMPL family transporter [Algicola sp.]|nr:MMPL family transporter [Algicola sp.]